MQLVIDVLLILVFAFLVFRGWRRGFMKSVLSLGRLILSVVITIVFGKAFAGWLDAKFINPPIYDAVFGKLSEIGDEVIAEANGSVDALAEKVPGFLRGHLDLESMDATDTVTGLVSDWSRTASDAISGIISTVIGYILLFLLAFLVLTIVIFIVGKLAKLPLLNKIDKLLGLCVGLVSGALGVMFLAVILGAILSVIDMNDVVENSFILKLFAGVKDLLFQ